MLASNNVNVDIYSRSSVQNFVDYLDAEFFQPKYKTYGQELNWPIFWAELLQVIPICDLKIVISTLDKHSYNRDFEKQAIETYNVYLLEQVLLDVDNT